MCKVTFHYYLTTVSFFGYVARNLRDCLVSLPYYGYYCYAKSAGEHPGDTLRIAQNAMASTDKVILV